MDSTSRKLMKELEEMQQTGRMLRNMSLARMLSLETGNWQPPVDLYEGKSEFFVYFDLAGADRESLSVTANEHQVRVSGRKELIAQKAIAGIHQLEIEVGVFERTIPLPAAVQVDGVTSSYANGILIITLPKKRKKGKVCITISAGDK